MQVLHKLGINAVREIRRGQGFRPCPLLHIQGAFLGGVLFEPLHQCIVCYKQAAAYFECWEILAVKERIGSATAYAEQFSQITADKVIHFTCAVIESDLRIA